MFVGRCGNHLFRRFATASLSLVLLSSCAAGTTTPRSTPTAGSPAAAGGNPAAGGPVRPRALVYRGPAGCPGCSEALYALIGQSALHFDVSYVGPDEATKLTAANLRGVALYAQPGGGDSIVRAMAAIDGEQATAIRDYVRAGGHYVGICMGAYLAGSDPGLGLLAPGDTGEYSATEGALVMSPADAVIPVWWGSVRRYAYVQDAPYIIPSGVVGERILSTFTNGRVNALVRPYGSGRVGVVGSHPEADRDWYTDALWAQDEDGLDSAQGLQLIAAVMGTG